MAQVNVYEAKAKLSELIDRVLSGEDIVIARAGKPVVTLKAITSRAEFPYGVLGDSIQIKEDFDEPLTEAELALFYNDQPEQ